MNQLVWDEAKLALGVAEMDATHREFVELAAAVQRSSDDEFPALFTALIEHTRKHFDNESRLMRACRFPATGEHEAEHLRVLGEMDYLALRIKTGRLTMARAYTEGLPIWFTNHTKTMDSALAACLKSTAEIHAVAR